MNGTYLLNLSFQTDLGKIYTLRLTGADPDVTAPEIKTAMQAVIDSGVITHKNGTPQETFGAELVTTETEIIDVK